MSTISRFPPHHRAVMTLGISLALVFFRAERKAERRHAALAKVRAAEAEFNATQEALVVAGLLPKRAKKKNKKKKKKKTQTQTQPKNRQQTKKTKDDQKLSSPSRPRDVGGSGGPWSRL